MESTDGRLLVDGWEIHDTKFRAEERDVDADSGGVRKRLQENFRLRLRSVLTYTNTS
jgi:hypothetical protein